MKKKSVKKASSKGSKSAKAGAQQQPASSATNNGKTTVLANIFDAGERYRSFVLGIRNEMKNVIWPEKNITLYIFAMVIAISFFSALFFTLVDGVSYRLVHTLITKFIA